MSSPCFTVVIATYNHAHFLQKALESVRNQTCTDWEAIVVNNFSEDDTVGVVERFGDSRIRLENFRNFGVIAASRNQGIALAQGEYVALLDSDDLWYAEKLSLCLEKLKQGCDVVCHGERWIGKGWDDEMIYGPERRATYDRLLFEENCLSTSAAVIRRECLTDVGGFSEDPKIIIAEDYDLWLRLAKKGCRFGFIPRVLGDYRIHDGNESKAASRSVNATLEVVEKHLGSRGVRWFERWRVCRRKALIYYGGARTLYHNRQYQEAWPYFFLAFKQWPLLTKLYPAMLINLICSWRYGESAT